MAMNTNSTQQRAVLQHIAHQAMLDRGLLADFPADALAELAKIQSPRPTDGTETPGPTPQLEVPVTGQLF